jgi:hypothetical protein
MATVSPSFSRSVGENQDGSVLQFQWTLTTANADGAPFQIPENADVTWVATGTWGGATLKVQGSADGTTFVATGLSNAAGGAEATAAADKVFTTIECPRYIRPILTTPGTGATVTVTAVARRASSIRN